MRKNNSKNTNNIREKIITNVIYLLSQYIVTSKAKGINIRRDYGLVQVVIPISLL